MSGYSCVLCDVIYLSEGHLYQDTIVGVNKMPLHACVSLVLDRKHMQFQIIRSHVRSIAHSIQYETLAY